MTLQLISLLLRAGHMVTAVTRKSQHSPIFRDFLAKEPQLSCREIEVLEEGIDVLLKDDIGANNIWNCDRLAPEAICFNLAARSFYRSNTFDLVVVSFIPDLGLLQTTAPILLNVFGLPPSRKVARIERSLLKKCTAYTFASNYTKTEFRDLFEFGQHPDLGPVIHASVPAVFFERPQTNNKRFDACYAGRFVRRKGLYYLFESISRLKHAERMNITLAMVGNGPERDALELSALELNIADQITWFGSVSAMDVAHIIGQSKTFVYATNAAEAFGCSILESMACGVPVITTNLGGTSDYVRPGENALICKPYCSGSISDALKNLLDNPELCAQLREQGLATAHKFHPSNITPHWITAFEEILYPTC